ncbi:hypothetical protein GE061_005000 [Apolygus lucorum]|uniref:Uncharacterized protein n=1 Tax=Apolygus lucorum TaxID=248454 RepID=A0A6A4J2I7_APOLU|nr:hypothetical protein GE061_005000 [Apolygus lucorum]
MKPDALTMNLDEEFKAGLNVLRPFILRLSSVEDAKLTRLWLEKLHEAVDERKLRNIFLRELTDQVQCGKLRFPFNKPPPLSPLYLCQDGGGERYSSSDSCSGSSKYFNPRKEGLFAEKRWINEAHNADSTASAYGDLRRGQGQSGRHGVRYRLPRRRRRFSERSEDQPEDVSGLLGTISSLQARNEALAQEIKLYQGSAANTQKNLDSVQQEVSILKNKLEEMRALNSCIEESNTNVVNDYRKVLTESVKRLSDRLDAVSKRNVTLEEKLEKLKNERKYLSSNNVTETEMRKTIKKLKKELEVERRSRGAEIEGLKKLLTQKENQLGQLDSHVQHQCDKMQKEVSSMKHEITRNPSLVYPTPMFKEKISGLRKHVYHVEKTNKRILEVFEKKLNQYKEECDRKINSLQKQVVCKDRLANNLQTALKKAETQYRKHISELQESCKAQRIFDHQRITSLEERLRQRLFE